MGIETILFVFFLIVAVPVGVVYLKSRRARGKPVAPGKEAERESGQGGTTGRRR